MFLKTKKSLLRVLAFTTLIVMILSNMPINIMAAQITTFSDSRYEYDDTDDIPYDYEKIEWDEEYYTYYEENYDDTYLYEGMEPEYEVPPERMSDEQIIAFATASLNDNIVYIDTNEHLTAFLNSAVAGDGRNFTDNAGHYVLRNNVTAPATTQGRQGIFTGIFDGGHHTITNLRLRPPTPAAARPGIGFIQQAGGHAVIRNVTFHESSGTNAIGATSSWLDEVTTAAWSNGQTGIGMVIGRTVPFEDRISTVSVYNVHLTGQMTMIQNRNTGAGYTQRRIGGMIGQVDRSSVLNIRDVSVEDVDILGNAGNTENRIHAAGGLVGAVEGGTLNVTASPGMINNVAVITRGGGRTNIAMGINRGGGILGFLFSGHANIENVETLPPRTAAGAIRAVNDGIHAIQMGGGIVGGSEVSGTITLRNVVSNVHRIRVTMAGGDTSASGRVGGLIGRVRNTVTIENSRNYTTVYQLGANAVIGGLIGYTGPVSVVRIVDSANGRFIPGFVPGIGNDAATNPDALIGQLRHWNSSGSAGANGFTPGTGSEHQTGRAEMGGIIGRSRGRLYISGTTNYGWINKRRANNNNTHVGGIIGRLHRPTSGEIVISANTVNRGEVFLGGAGTAASPTARGNAGGIIGTITGRGTAHIEINGVSNHGPVTGGARNGGLIGQNSAASVVIRNSDNYGNTEGAPNWATGTTAASDNRPTITAARARVASAGGILGFASGVRLHVTNSENHGDISIRGTATARANNVGGIVGQLAGRDSSLRDVRNYGNVDGRERTGGIIGRSVGIGITVVDAINRGNVTTHVATAPVGGIVGRSERRNLLILNAGNFGTVAGGSGAGTGSGAGGIIGRDQGASARVERSFNQGHITGGIATGGLVGRSQGGLIISDVYNIGTVNTAGTVAQQTRHGNGILGRRQSGAVRISRAWVSGNFRGYSVATSGTGTGNVTTAAPVAGITFSQVYVDNSTLSSANTTDFTTANPRHQENRAGITLIDTELLTSGFLPGVASGPWRYGLVESDGSAVDFDEQRTFPYFYWQVRNEQGNPRLQETFFDTIRWYDVEASRDLAVMDLERTGATVVNFTGVSNSGIRAFHPYQALTAGFPNVVAGSSSLASFTRGTVAAPLDTSIGLIHPSGVVGFETRDVPARIMIRGYDPLFGNPTIFVDHANISIVSEDAYEVTNAPRNLFIEGLAIIHFSLDEFGDIHGITPGSTEARIEAWGYEPLQFIIEEEHLGELTINENISGTRQVNQPMTRRLEEIRVWLRDFPSEPAETEANDYAPPGSAIVDSVLYHSRPPGWPAPPIAPPTNRDADRTGTTSDPLTGTHFVIVNAMIGDNFIGSAPLRSTEEAILMFRDLIPRDGNIDLDMYLENLALGVMEFRFIEESGIDVNNSNEGGSGDIIRTRINIGSDVSPNLSIRLHNHPEGEVQATYSRVTTGLTHFNVGAVGSTGSISRNTTFDVISENGEFENRYSLLLDDFLEYVVQEGGNTDVDLDDESVPALQNFIYIPLRRLVEEEFRVVANFSGFLLPIPHSTLIQEDGTPESRLDGTFTIRVLGMMNRFIGNALGFSTEIANLSRVEIDQRLAEDGYLYLELERQLPAGTINGFVWELQPIEGADDYEVVGIIPYANVVIINEQGVEIYRTIADSNGHFSVTNEHFLPDTTFIVIGSHEGFEPVTSFINPTTLDATGSSHADVFLNATDNDYLLVATINGEHSPNDLSVVLISYDDYGDQVVSNFEFNTSVRQWQLRSNGPMIGTVVVSISNMNINEILVNNVIDVIEEDYIGRVAVVSLNPEIAEAVVVTFDRGYENAEGSVSVSISRGYPIYEPTPAPQREGFVFGGWARDVDGEFVIWNFEDNVTEDMTLYAQWIPEHTVTFTVNPSEGGTLNGTTSITVNHGHSISASEIPTPEPHTGWSFTD
ncbi:MAG: InlB B-repeat-containing protein, partial [Defluviitaleaceae bacterium]|nr:InlB B-repeat-containing protein [Defluviitaleaceae bacterium]